MRCAGVAVRRLEPFERQCEVRAAFGGDERVNLVDDHGVHRAQHLPGVRGEQQVERLGCRDQDVGRLTLEPRALRGGRVASPNGHGGNVKRLVAGVSPIGDAGNRRPQVAFDVDRQRLQRRHVEDATSAFAAARLRREHDSVDRPQKRRERLAASRGRQNQRRFTARDGGPSLRLWRRRRRKRRLEPVRDRTVKQVEHAGAFAHGSIMYSAISYPSYQPVPSCTAAAPTSDV